jgi:hypothetical protein
MPMPEGVLVYTGKLGERARARAWAFASASVRKVVGRVEGDGAGEWMEVSSWCVVRVM